MRRAVLVLVALVAGLPGAAEGARKPVAVKVLGASAPAVAGKGQLRVVLTPRRAGRVRVSASARRVGTARHRTVARPRRVVLRRGRARVVRLALTRRGRSLLRSCTPVRVRVRVKRVRGPGRQVSAVREMAGRPARCGAGTGVPGAAPGDWPMWGFDLTGSRHNPHERAITRENVGKLELKWAFSVPNTDGAQSSQPAVVGDTVYVGGRNGIFYALDVRSGRKRWEFDTRTVAGDKLPNPGLFPDPSASSGTNPLRDGAVVADGLVYFGDFNGFVYALDARTGRLRWATEVDDYPQAILTGSPTYYDGSIYIGVSSNEVFTAITPTYECCKARGSMVALDAATGKMRWKFYTVPEPQPAGTNSYGARRFEPSGVAVWSTPAIDHELGTVHFGDSQNYTGKSELADSMIALDVRSGEKRWHRQMTDADKWTAACLSRLPGGNCPEPGPDFDFGSSPNLFSAGGRRIMGEGQKSGVYHALDARTGEIVWQTVLNKASGEGGAGGQEGIQWGSAYDGRRIYVATNQASPGTLFALDPATGKVLWDSPNPADGCSTGGALASRPGDCELALPAAVSTIPGLVFEGSRDGKMRAYDAASGEVVWQYDTVRPYTSVTGEPGKGGSISGGGAAISRGMVFVNSGYQTANSAFTGITGNMVLAFGLP